ncbi:MAG: hypothetical protein EZS28_000804 [Streblomastix strix]|uniref:Uncharacterized protein n=1 Tax=Streblomastix strix TaxID=222440 RepID=A0A5J4X969_9EUKA|nr:MAG: hypothetical protein EZS28_000804 [Streblomastix strix]
MFLLVLYLFASSAFVEAAENKPCDPLAAFNPFEDDDCLEAKGKHEPAQDNKIIKNNLHKEIIQPTIYAKFTAEINATENSTDNQKDKAPNVDL